MLYSEIFIVLQIKEMKLSCVKSSIKRSNKKQNQRNNEARLLMCNKLDDVQSFVLASTHFVNNLQLFRNSYFHISSYFQNDLHKEPKQHWKTIDRVYFSGCRRWWSRFGVMTFWSFTLTHSYENWITYEKLKHLWT